MVEKINLAQIVPSDSPRFDSWETAKERSVRILGHIHRLELSRFKIEVYQFNDITTVQNGNHFLASILHFLGDMDVIFTPTNPAHYKAGQWLYQIQRVQSEGIFNYFDFIQVAEQMTSDGRD